MSDCQITFWIKIFWQLDKFSHTSCFFDKHDIKSFWFVILFKCIFEWSLSINFLIYDLFLKLCFNRWVLIASYFADHWIYSYFSSITFIYQISKHWNQRLFLMISQRKCSSIACQLISEMCYTSRFIKSLIIDDQIEMQNLKWFCCLICRCSLHYSVHFEDITRLTFNDFRCIAFDNHHFLNVFFDLLNHFEIAMSHS